MAHYGEWETYKTKPCECGGTITISRREVSCYKAPCSYDNEEHTDTGYDWMEECDSCDYADYEPADLTD